MNNKLLWGVIALLLVALVGWLVFQQTANRAIAPETGDEAEETDGETVSEVPAGEGVEEKVVDGDGTDDAAAGGTLVEYTESGFSPSVLTVEAGTEVTFVNRSGSSVVWPASAIHPTHKAYPGSDIALCGTAEALGIFDACGAVGPGERFSFTFNEVGEWRYHNHLNVSQTGTIVVTE